MHLFRLCSIFYEICDVAENCDRAFQNKALQKMVIVVILYLILNECIGGSQNFLGKLIPPLAV